MAGDWIKWQKGLSWKPKVLQISKKVNLSRRETATVLMELWEWADEITDNGHAVGVTFVTVDTRTNVTGLSQAMCDVGWLCETSDGVLFHDFERHNSNSSRARLLSNERKRRQRSRQNVTLAS